MAPGLAEGPCRRSDRAWRAAAREYGTADDLFSAVVQLKTYINPEGRTVRGLGQQRAGSGIVIDDKGLTLTIGYLMVEAHAAEVVTTRRQGRGRGRRL